MTMCAAEPAVITRPHELRPLPVLAHPYGVRIAPSDSGGTMLMTEQSIPVGQGVPMHTHAHEDETFYVLDGQIRFDTADGSTVAGAGTSVFLPRGNPHAWFVAGDRPARFLLIVTPGEGFHTMFEELSRLPEGAPDMATVGTICARYGITFA